MGNDTNLCYCHNPSVIYNTLMETTNKDDFEQGIIGLTNIVSGLLNRIEQLENANSKKFDISSVSKIVGWKQKHIVYPTLQEITDLEIKHADEPFYIAYRLLMYTRFLPAPASEKEKEVLKKIISLQEQYIEAQKG